MSIVKIEVKFDPTTGLSINPSSPNMVTGDEVEWTIDVTDECYLTIALNHLSPMDWKVAPGPCPVAQHLTKGTHVVTRKVEDPRDFPKGKDRLSDTALYTVSLRRTPLSSTVPITASGSLVIERGVEPVDGCRVPRYPQDRQINASHQGGAGTPGPSREEQRLGQ